MKITVTLQILYNEIEAHSQRSLYDKTDPAHILSQKVTNMISLLHKNAIILSKSKEMEKENHLILSKLTELMSGLLEILENPDFTDKKDSKIKQLIQTYGLDPNELFVENPPVMLEHIRVQDILKGNYIFLS